MEEKKKRNRPKIIFDYKKLILKICEKFGTRSRFCQVMGMRPQVLSAKLNNIVAISASEMYLMAYHLDIPDKEIGSIFLTPKSEKAEE